MPNAGNLDRQGYAEEGSYANLSSLSARLSSDPHQVSMFPVIVTMHLAKAVAAHAPLFSSSTSPSPPKECKSLPISLTAGSSDTPSATARGGILAQLLHKDFDDKTLGLLKIV